MLTTRFFRAVAKGNPAAIATLASGLALPAIPATVITCAIMGDALIEPTKALNRFVQKKADRWERERQRRHELQMQRERIAAAEHAEELRRANQPKPISKQERLDALNAELLANLRILDLSLIPDEDKAALRNREIDVYQSKLRRVLES